MHNRKNSYKNSKGVRHFMLIIPVLRRQRSERSRFKASPTQIVCEILVQKYPTQNRNGEITEVVECLPSKIEDLSSKTNT
jgi:hypothetical protein